MHASLVTTSAAECATLRDDLLADSERLYHRQVTNLQKAVHEQWLFTVRDQTSREPAVFHGESLAQVEARVRERLAMFRQDLRRRQAVLIAEECEKRAGRDRAIRAYVASLFAQKQSA